MVETPRVSAPLVVAMPEGAGCRQGLEALSYPDKNSLVGSLPTSGIGKMTCGSAKPVTGRPQERRGRGDASRSRAQVSGRRIVATSFGRRSPIINRPERKCRRLHREPKFLREALPVRSQNDQVRPFVDEDLSQHFDHYSPQVWTIALMRLAGNATL